jgi:hypothetical protein
VRLEGLGQLKNPITPSGLEPATFRLVPVPQPNTLTCAPDIKEIWNGLIRLRIRIRMGNVELHIIKVVF